MKIFVISDTHGRLENAEDVWSRLHDIDLVIHLGDYEKDAQRLAQIFQTEVISVKGNMDGSYSREDYKIVETEAGNLLLTHGHMYNVKANPLNLLYLAQEQDCCAVLFGHTHIPFYEEAQGVYLVNPGSLSLPRDGSQGSYAIINTEKEGFHCAIVYYSGSRDSHTKKAPQKRRLRDLLNYSDRF